MSKYDFELDLSLNSSTGLILNKIQPGSVILEFGCASGRMTRYMKEQLSCQVYIVEYDRTAFETACVYAEDGLCDDIMNFQWVQKFSGILFDAIIFADVLEHLTAPEQVLEQAAALLRDGGAVYASIPNITHNDILLKAYRDRFDYTSTGILDDTHIHFWGLKNLENLSGKWGLSIGQIEATYCSTGQTEQFQDTAANAQSLLVNILKERACGEVYQFVVTFYKHQALEPIYSIKQPAVRSHIYLDTGKDFNSNDVIEIEAVYSGSGTYLVHYVLADVQNIKRVKFDPVEYQSCILRNISIMQGKEALSLIYPDAIALGEDMLLPGKDPMVYVHIRPTGEPVIIDAEIVLPGENYLSLLEDGLKQNYFTFNQVIKESSRTNEELKNTIQRLDENNESLKNNISALLLEQDNLQKTIADLLIRQDVLNRQIASLVSEKDSMEKTVANCQDENAKLQGKLGAYIMLATKKDEYVIEIEKSLKHISDENGWLKEHVSNLSDINTSYVETIDFLNAEIEELRTSRYAYMLLARNKDSYALELEGQLNTAKLQNEMLLKALEEASVQLSVKDADIAAQSQTITELNQNMTMLNMERLALEQDRDFFKNLRIVRIRTKIVRVVKGIVRRIKRLIGQEES